MSETKRTYEDLIEEASEHRTELNQVMHARYKAIRKSAEQLSGIDGGSFKRVVDLSYYKGGWPKPDTPPKIDTVATEIANLLKLEKAVDKDNLAMALLARGIRVEVLAPVYIGSTTPMQKSAIADFWPEAALDNPMPETVGEGLRVLHGEAMKLQKAICETADIIKLELAAEAKDEHGILRPNFNQAVALRALQKSKGHDKMLVRAEKLQHDRIDNLSEAIDPVVGKDNHE